MPQSIILRFHRHIDKFRKHEQYRHKDDRETPPILLTHDEYYSLLEELRPHIMGQADFGDTGRVKQFMGVPIGIIP